jgi:hypothetical protein
MLDLGMLSYCPSLSEIGVGGHPSDRLAGCGRSVKSIHSYGKRIARQSARFMSGAFMRNHRHHERVFPIIVHLRRRL